MTRLQALKKVITDGSIDLDIIVNPKVTDDGQPIIQVRSMHNAARKLSQAFSDAPSWKRLQARQ